MVYLDICIFFIYVLIKLSKNFKCDFLVVICNLFFIQKIKYICINCVEFKNFVIFVLKCSFFILILWKYFIILGNLYLNLIFLEYSIEVMDKIELFLYDWVANYKGSISVEYGLGFKKKNFIYYSKLKLVVRLMKDIKYIFDFNMILNFYKVLLDF